MKRILLVFYTFTLLLALPITVQGQTTAEINPTATFVDVNNEEVEAGSDGLSAPIVGTFRSNPTTPDGYTANIVWTIKYHAETESQYRDDPYAVRYSEDMDMTFAESGFYNVSVTATFVQGKDTIVLENEVTSSLHISTSKLEMPNAFSPNGDGYNDVYKAKDTHKSIVEFKATIFNRWGKKLYEWTNIDEGWDGKYNGSDVPDGVYYVLVKALGADGRKYSIHRDVNLLRGYQENTTSSSE